MFVLSQSSAVHVTFTPQTVHDLEKCTPMIGTKHTHPSFLFSLCDETVSSFKCVSVTFTFP